MSNPLTLLWGLHSSDAQLQMKNRAGFENLILKCDEDIRAGRAEAVSVHLSAHNLARCPREYRLPLAKICRRAGLITTGLNLLSGLVHAGDSQPATASERAGYASLLIRIGAVNEAMAWLSAVDGRDTPDVFLYRAFAHFGRWEYLQAIDELKSYVENATSAYSQLVGQMNLALAHVEIRRHAPALEILRSTIEQCRKESHRQILSNCHALRAQAMIQEGRWKEARKELDTAKSLILLGNSPDHRFVVKLSLLLEAMESRSTAPCDTLEALSLSNHDWEARRDADLYRLKIAFNQERYAHLYFGTPYSGFRRIFETELGRPDRSAYVFGPKDSPRFDLPTGRIDDSEIHNLSTKCHQLIEILVRDLYQPLRIGGLFSALFEGEYFNVTSSPERVRQIIWRTRRWLNDEKIPVQISEASGFYSLNIIGRFSFRIPLERRPIDPYFEYFDKLMQAFANQPSFTARDAAAKLELPKSTVHKMMSQWIDKKLIQRLGTTNTSSTYKFSAKSAA